jgi:hypothetical protein
MFFLNSEGSSRWNCQGLPKRGVKRGGGVGSGKGWFLPRFYSEYRLFTQGFTYLIDENCAWPKMFFLTCARISSFNMRDIITIIDYGRSLWS